MKNIIKLKEEKESCSLECNGKKLWAHESDSPQEIFQKFIDFLEELGYKIEE